MKVYFIEEKGEQKGPFTLSELKEENVLDSTLIWTEGLENWTLAININELKPILIVSPPPLPKNISASITKENNVNVNIGFKSPFKAKKKSQNIDELNTEKKNIPAIIIGVLIISLQIIFSVSGLLNSQNEFTLFSISLFILRIVFTVWVVNISKSKNRNSDLWGLFSFLFPSITLITIGMVKKLNKPDYSKLTKDTTIGKQEYTLNNNFSSVNNFCISIKEIEVPSNIKSSLENDNQFLIYSIKEIKRYIKFFKSKEYPFYAALTLDSKNIKLSSDLLINLKSVAEDYFHKNTINEVLMSIKNG